MLGSGGLSVKLHPLRYVPEPQRRLNLGATPAVGSPNFHFISSRAGAPAIGLPPALNGPRGSSDRPRHLAPAALLPQFSGAI